MDWQRLCIIAAQLRGVEVDAKLIRVKGQPFVRLVDAETVAFAVAEPHDRDPLIARAPSVFFITDRFAAMPVVLARIDMLELGEARERTREAWRITAPPEATENAKTPAGPRLYYLAYITDHDVAEKRKFKVLGRGTAAGWLLAQWRAWRAGKAWGEKLPHEQANTIEHHFQRAADDDIEPPASDEAARAVVCEVFHCTPHMYNDGGDDDEGLEWQFYIFDDEYFGEDASDYLPHPDRGDRSKREDDPYRQLLAKHGKHRRTTR